ncbi:UDP-N-acetylmuramoyl-L-alanyl-D-glutamate--2,6-diaminopimelate ligase [Patescibacteria group bacterium]|nr:UDP-N-acetylmuramoyl-L-alanyl-D-glutamate--2,6-diaminopimelate ligase [Patescibacteria group bacterium]
MFLIHKKARQLVYALIAIAVNRYPARKLKVIGVTGTDGKTTTVNLIYHILNKAGKKVSVISTVGAIIGTRKIETGFHTTTPDPFLLQKLLREAGDKQSEYMILEVSSHGLDQFRVLGCNFYVGVLTNITHEHLDYHKAFKKYVEAKAKLFTSSKIAVLNRTDHSFNKIAKIIKSSGRKIKIMSYPDEKLSYKLKQAIIKRFPEPYNFLNSEAAIKVAQELGISEVDIVKGIKAFPGVPGRMEEIPNKKGFRVIVDFAHTPNGLEKVLKVLKNQKRKQGKLISVFGCAGERDIEKRPMMGKISSGLADISVFTAEDPRHEDVNKIIDAMVKGAKKERGKVYRIEDRKEAIRFAITKLAKKEDIVVICGKGPEKSMAFGDKELPWGDKKIAEGALSKITSQ